MGNKSILHNKTLEYNSLVRFRFECVCVLFGFHTVRMHRFADSIQRTQKQAFIFLQEDNMDGNENNYVLRIDAENWN